MLNRIYVFVRVRLSYDRMALTRSHTHTLPFQNNYNQKHPHRIKSNYLRKWTLNETGELGEHRASTPTLWRMHRTFSIEYSAEVPEMRSLLLLLLLWAMRLEPSVWSVMRSVGKKTFFRNYLKLIKTKLQWSRRTVRNLVCIHPRMHASSQYIASAASLSPFPCKRNEYGVGVQFNLFTCPKC